ncbi:hypothetical protein ACROYT_G033110 [Oculina patagonica]
MWVLSCALLVRHLETSAQGSRNSTHQDEHLKQFFDKRCEGVLKRNGFWDARCYLNGSSRTLAPMILFESLDLSRNSLQSIPTEFLLNQSHLVNLTLAHNYISTIKDGAFGKLYNVTFLDLSFNPLQRWEGDVLKQLPNLVTLVVTGDAWIPESNVLGLPSLQRILGVTWSHECTNCTLFKANLSAFSISNVEHRNGKLVTKFVEHGFYPFCSQRVCSPSMLIYPDKSEIVKMTNVPKKLFYSSYVLGAIAILLNFVILFTVVSSKSLRKTTSMLLIANMALCDLLIGIYSVIIGSLNIFNFLSNVSVKTGGEKLVLGGGILCPLASSIFTSAECVAAVTSLLLTIEKYCSIVHCMDRGHCLSKKVAAICLLFVWATSLGYALCPLLHVPNLSYSATMMCSFPVAKKNTFLICLGVLIALYIANIPLYAGIFLFSSRSGARLGVRRRNAAVLKRIALVIGSNFLFLLTPMILIITFVPVENIDETIELNSEPSTQMLFVFGFWFPIACLGLNACINPFLFAFRQEQFVKQIKKLLQMIGLVRAPMRQEGPAPMFELSSKVSPQVVLTKFTQYNK